MYVTQFHVLEEKNKSCLREKLFFKGSKEISCSQGLFVPSVHHKDTLSFKFSRTVFSFWRNVEM